MHYYLAPACSEEVLGNLIHPRCQVSNINVWVFGKCVRTSSECVQTAFIHLALHLSVSNAESVRKKIFSIITSFYCRKTLERRFYDPASQKWKQFPYKTQ